MLSGAATTPFLRRRSFGKITGVPVVTFPQRLTHSSMRSFCDLPANHVVGFASFGSEEILQPELDLSRPSSPSRRRRSTSGAHSLPRRPARRDSRRTGPAHHRRKPRRLDRIHEPADVLRRNADPNTSTEHIARQLRRTLHRRRPTASAPPRRSAFPQNPAADTSRCTRSNISSIRWWMMCASSSRGICRSPCATVLGSWITSDGSTSGS